MINDPAAPLLYAAAQIVVAFPLSLPALFIGPLRHPLKLASVGAFVVFALVFALVATFDITSPTGRPPLGAVFNVALLGGIIWATVFFVLAYVPLAMVALLRQRTQ